MQWRGGVGVSPVPRTNHDFSLAFCWQDIGLMSIILVSLNVLDIFSTIYAINILGLMELNPISVSFPVWLTVLKFGACFIPLTCAYILEKLNMKNYLLFPFAFSTILIEFYAFVVAFNIQNILGA